MTVRDSLDGGLGGAFERDGVARQAAAAGLALVLVVDLVEDGDERAGLELVGDGGDLAETGRTCGRRGGSAGSGLGLAEARHLAIMMVQEKMLASSRMPRTVKAMGPLLWTISRSALLLAAAGGCGCGVVLKKIAERESQTIVVDPPVV